MCFGGSVELTAPEQYSTLEPGVLVNLSQIPSHRYVQSFFYRSKRMHIGKSFQVWDCMSVYPRMNFLLLYR